MARVASLPGVDRVSDSTVREGLRAADQFLKDTNERLDAPPLVPDWRANRAYDAGQLVSLDGVLWRAVRTHTSGARLLDSLGSWIALGASFPVDQKRERVVGRWWGNQRAIYEQSYVLETGSNPGTNVMPHNIVKLDVSKAGFNSWTARMSNNDNQIFLGEGAVDASGSGGFKVYVSVTDFHVQHNNGDFSSQCIQFVFQYQKTSDA